MGVKERKQRQRDERRELILQAAGEIIANEGTDSLSIRKIANKIEYSPAIIYHYFRNKDEILEQLMKKGYQKIVGGLMVFRDSTEKPRDKLVKMTRTYIDTALQNPEEYKTYMLSNSPQVLKHTAVLFHGAAAQRPAIGMLCQTLKEIYGSKITDDELELTAQAIWASTYGLIVRLILEKIPARQRNRLIDYHTKFILSNVLASQYAK